MANPNWTDPLDWEGEDGRLGVADRATHAGAPGLSSRPGHSVSVADADFVVGEDHEPLASAHLEPRQDQAGEAGAATQVVGGLVCAEVPGEALAGSPLLDQHNAHTPGTWYVDGTFVFALNSEGTNRFSAQVQGGHADSAKRTTTAEREATARLIAAAPELKDGCNAMLGLVQLILGRSDLSDELRTVLTSNHRIAEAEAAVAKARGEAA